MCLFSIKRVLILNYISPREEVYLSSLLVYNYASNSTILASKAYFSVEENIYYPNPLPFISSLNREIVLFASSNNN